ncbi:MAG TPA: AAA family ATPase [Phytomonospora sp.]
MSAPELIITRGYAAVGKTTKALDWIAGDPENRVRVNRDDLRLATYGRHTGLSFKQEQAVTAAQHAAVRALLAAGKSVIVDDTNLRLKYARAYADIAYEAGVRFEVWDLIADLDQVLLQDRARRNAGGRGVGEQVIRAMAARYPLPWPVVTPTEKATWRPDAYFPDVSLPPAWIIDVDGTIAHNDGHRGWYDWPKVGGDKPIRPVLGLVTALAAARYHLIIMSGRDEVCRPETEAWLAEYLPIGYTELHMRGAGDQRPDDLVKSEMFDKHVRYRWNVKGVVDDRPRVCRMWRAMGLTVAQVGDPHKEF